MFRESVLVFFIASLPPERREQDPDRRTQASNEGDDSDVKGPFPSGGGRESNPPRNPRSGWAGEMATRPGGSAGALAEADGNRTRPGTRAAGGRVRWPPGQAGPPGGWRRGAGNETAPPGG